MHKLMNILIVTSILLFTCSCGSNTNLKKAGAESIDEEIRMNFPGLENYQNSEKFDTSVSLISVKELRLNKDVKLNVRGSLAISGRVAVTQKTNVYGVDAVKIYLLYSKNDCSDFIVRNSKPYKVSYHDTLFPLPMTSPRYVKNAVLTILNPDNCINELKRGDYFSLTGDWGSIDTHKYSRDSHHGVNNFFIYLNGYNIKQPKTEIYKFRTLTKPDKINVSIKKPIIIRKEQEEITLKIIDYKVSDENNFHTTALKYAYTYVKNGKVTKGENETQLVYDIQETGGCKTFSINKEKNNNIINISDISLPWAIGSFDSSVDIIRLQLSKGDAYSRQDDNFVITLK